MYGRLRGFTHLRVQAATWHISVLANMGLRVAEVFGARVPVVTLPVSSAAVFNVEEGAGALLAIPQNAGVG